MQIIKKDYYKKPQVEIIEVETDQMVCVSVNYKVPEVQNDEDEVASPYWDVL